MSWKEWTNELRLLWEELLIVAFAAAFFVVGLCCGCKTPDIGNLPDVPSMPLPTWGEPVEADPFAAERAVEAEHGFSDSRTPVYPLTVTHLSRGHITMTPTRPQKQADRRPEWKGDESCDSGFLVYVKRNGKWITGGNVDSQRPGNTPRSLDNCWPREDGTKARGDWENVGFGPVSGEEVAVLLVSSPSHCKEGTERTFAWFGVMP